MSTKTKRKPSGFKRRKSRTRLVGVGAAAVGVLIVTLLLTTGSEPGGDPAPDIALANFAGETVRISDFEGQPLVVLFGEVVLEDAGGGCPAERSVGSVVIVEVDEPVVRLSTFVL